MTRSRLHGRILALWWALAAIAAAPPALARQDKGTGDQAATAARASAAPDTQRPSAAPRSVAPLAAARLPGEAPSAAPATTTPPAAVPDRAPPGAADGAVPAVVAPTVAGGAATPPPPPPDPTEGDRNALINQDVIRHPPQTRIPSRDPSHLQTARMKLGGLLDRSVRSVDNSEVGRVIDVMTGDDGRPAALELDVGGFLGVGNRRIAVAWTLFDLSRTGQNDPLRVALSAAQVRSAPAMDDAGETPVVTGAAPVSAEPPATGSGGAVSPGGIARPTAAIAPAGPVANPPAAAAPAATIPGTAGTTPATVPAADLHPSPPAAPAHAASPAAGKPGTSPPDASRAASPPVVGHEDRDGTSRGGDGEPRP